MVSLKLCYDSEEGALQRLNDKLPPAIVAVGFRRVTAGFDARKQCDRCSRLSARPPRFISHIFFLTCHLDQLQRQFARRTLLG